MLIGVDGVRISGERYRAPPQMPLLNLRRAPPDLKNRLIRIWGVSYLEILRIAF